MVEHMEIYHQYDEMGIETTNMTSVFLVLLVNQMALTKGIWDRSLISTYFLIFQVFYTIKHNSSSGCFIKFHSETLQVVIK